MRDFISRLSNVIAWLSFIYFACIITSSLITGADKFTRMKSVNCIEFAQKDIDMSNMDLLSDDELEMIISCPNKDLKYYEKVETSATFTSWLLHRLILCVPGVIGVILNYLMTGRLRLLPWEKPNDEVKNTEI